MSASKSRNKTDRLHLRLHPEVTSKLKAMVGPDERHSSVTSLLESLINEEYRRWSVTLSGLDAEQVE